WTVHALLSHVVGVAADLAAGRVDRWSQPSWTAGHVAARAGRSRGELLAEWDAYESDVAAIVDNPALRGLDDMFRRVPMIDLIAHEHDVREAVCAIEELRDADWAILGVHRAFWLDAFAKDVGVPPLRVMTNRGDDWVVGGERPQATVNMPRQELWRSLEG